MRIKRITKIGVVPVYDLYVEKHHNFISDGGVVLHNCDALRYWCVAHTLAPKEIEEITPETAEQKMLADHKEAVFRKKAGRRKVVR